MFILSFLCCKESLLPGLNTCLPSSISLRKSKQSFQKKARWKWVGRFELKTSTSSKAPSWPSQSNHNLNPATAPDSTLAPTRTPQTPPSLTHAFLCVMLLPAFSTQGLSPSPSRLEVSSAASLPLALLCMLALSVISVKGLDLRSCAQGPHSGTSLPRLGLHSELLNFSTKPNRM